MTAAVGYAFPIDARWSNQSMTFALGKGGKRITEQCESAVM
jgi:hypothetical protein